MFRNITLELSLKPFKQTDNEYIKKVCREIYTGWYPLLKNREEISIMMWCSDGSQILDYAGLLDDEFSWACFIGNANRPLADETDELEMSPHRKKRYYMKNPPKMTYGILKTIVSCLKNTGKEFFPNSRITVGETFDIGPEFAESDFKYVRHTEICGGGEFVGKFVDTAALLNDDDRTYAAFPNGIPDKTPIGYFLGMQSEQYTKDLGFDFLWLSNGMGFSLNPWNRQGKIYDGENFHEENLDTIKESVWNFWKLFRKGCPSLPLRVRGTNYSAGIDYATDAVPLHEIYNADLNFMAPPNSPWAALNDNYGLEIMGHMTRCAHLPNDDMLFRYYIHDPWWINSPWYDRYQSSPHDIYLPMAISRIDENGNTKSANVFNILSIDNSYGDMPQSCIYEPLPHIQKAEKESPDAPGPLVWVYPVREYTTSTTNDELRKMYFGDTFIQEAINSGLPLNCVVSTDNFNQHLTSLYQSCVIVTPVPVSDETDAHIRECAKKGISVLMYGDISEISKYKNIENIKTVDMYGAPEQMRTALSQVGYSIIHTRKDEHTKVPAMTIARYDNGMIFSVYNPNTTTTSSLKFPLGAPILQNCETELVDGYATYHFDKSEHRECRVFVKQNEGVISCKEATCGCYKVRRRINIYGLKDATVSFFGEAYCKNDATAGYVQPNWSLYPKTDPSWHIVEDPKNGTYLQAEHITGDICLFMPTRIEWN